MGFHDILKDVFSHCDDKAELIACVWAGYISISENTLKSTFKSEFLGILGDQRETDLFLAKRIDELTATKRELAATHDTLNVTLAELTAKTDQADQLMVKHRQLASVVQQEQASRKHVQQKYFAEVEHRTAMAEEVAEARELEGSMRAEHGAALDQAKRATEQAVRADTARRHAQENMRRYLDDLKSVRQKDEQQTVELASLQTRLVDVTAELEEASAHYQEEARGKLVLQTELSSRRLGMSELNHTLLDLEDHVAELNETIKDAASREESITLERDLLASQLASTNEGLSSTQGTLLRERAGYSKINAEWAQMVKKLEDLTSREGAAVTRGLALSADVEGSRGSLRLEREAHAVTWAARQRAEDSVASLGIGVATLAQLLSDERLARRSLHVRLGKAASLEARVHTLVAAEKGLREDAAAARTGLDNAQGEARVTATVVDTLTTNLSAATDQLALTQSELSTVQEQLRLHTKDLHGSAQALQRALAETKRMAESALQAGEEKLMMATDLREVRKQHHDAAVRVDRLQEELGEAKTRGDQALGGLEEAVKKLSIITERVRILETENVDKSRKADNVSDEILSLRRDRDFEINQREKADTKYNDVVSKVSTLEASLVDSDFRVGVLQLDLGNAHEQVEALKVEVGITHQLFGAEKDALEAQLRDEHEACEAKSLAMDAMETELSTAQVDLSVLNAGREKMLDDSQQLERMLKEAQVVRAFLQGEIVSYKTRCEQFKLARAEAEVKLDLLQVHTEQEAVAASVKFDEAHFSLTTQVCNLEEDLASERAARIADVDVVRQEGADQVKAWRESLMAEIGTQRLEQERVEREVIGRDLELDKAATSAKVAAMKVEGLERRLQETEKMFTASAITGDEEKQHKHALGTAVIKLNEQVANAAATIVQLEGSNATLGRQLAALKMAKDADATAGAIEAAAAATAAAAAADAAVAAVTAAAAAAAEESKHAVALKWARGVQQQPGNLVVIQRKEPFERDRGHDQTLMMEFNSAALRTLVMQIWCEKMVADVEDAENSGEDFTSQSLEECTYDFFLSRFGLRSAAELQLRALVDAIQRDYSKDPRVQVFGRLIGVAQPLPADACRTLLAFLSQLFRLTGGLGDSELNGGQSLLPVDIVTSAIEASCPRRLTQVLATGVKAAAAASADGGYRIDLDVAVSLVVRHWERASEVAAQDLGKMFSEADVNGDGVLTYDEFSAVVRAASAAQSADQFADQLADESATSQPATIEVTARTCKRLFREALSASSLHGSGITPAAFAATMRQHGLDCQSAVTAVSSAQGGQLQHLPPFSGPLAFDECPMLDGSWAKMKATIAVVDEALAATPARQGELDALRSMVEAFEGILAARTPAAAGWALYRRILVVHAAYDQRVEIGQMAARTSR